jgi:hypothetical protein
MTNADRSVPARAVPARAAPATAAQAARLLTRARLLVWPVMVALALAGTVLSAQIIPKGLRYGQRGTYSEGLRGDPRSGAALVLVSATAAGTAETLTQWPENLRMRFFLPKEQPNAFIDITQIESLTSYYTLAEVKSNWKAGSANEIRWKADVVRDVYEYQTPEAQWSAPSRNRWLAGLGVQVTFEPLEKLGLQKRSVAPALISSATQASAVTAYHFTFTSTMPSATVTGHLKSAAGTTYLSGLKYLVTSRTPFTVEWRPPSTQAEGWYTLTVEARTAPGEPHAEVSFFHKRQL